MINRKEADMFFRSSKPRRRTLSRRPLRSGPGSRTQLDPKILFPSDLAPRNPRRGEARGELD
jgi:hypothetical protein